MTLTDAQHAFLVEEAHRTGLSLAELVRRALEANYQPEHRPRLRGFDVSLRRVALPGCCRGRPPRRRQRADAERAVATLAR